METTFMTIHNLTPEANIMYASESIVDVLGYQPNEVTGRSCFDYFHPNEVPFARVVHNRGVRMDKAAALHYARVRARDGQWIGCECVFTVVYDVLVACTSIYRQGDEKNERRAAEGRNVRRLFASSPKDPRYHMLEYLSAKFRAAPQVALTEPRAALILNRFTRTLTVMYATDAISGILGISADQFTDKSFYECIQENCLPDAIRCLESAKANDSIAYLRFWYRDPRRPEDFEDEEMRDASQSSDSDDGGVKLGSHTPRPQIEVDSNLAGEGSSNHVIQGPTFSSSGQETSEDDNPAHSKSSSSHPRASSGESTDLEHDSATAIFDQAQGSRSSTSSVIVTRERRQARAASAAARRAATPVVEPYELEAVVSCTSDGLVVILRRARHPIPDFQQPARAPQFANGLFAAPWGANPIHPHIYQPNPQYPFQHGPEAPAVPAGGPQMDDFMNSIREVAVFAWSLAGINGNIASYGHGEARGEAQPPGGLPVWDPHAQPAPEYFPPMNQAEDRWAQRDIKMSNAPADGNVVPFQHPREEARLRYQDGYGDGAMGSDHDGRAHATLARGGYVFQGPEAWVRNGYEGLYGAPPSTQAPGQGEGSSSGANLYRWQ